MIEVIQGCNLKQGADIEKIKINQKESKHHIPSTRAFRIFKFKNPATQRFLKILKCDHPRCPMNFRKWHNFYDHLRIHTKERPFVCPYRKQLNCNLTFTQKSNLNKHVRSHLAKQPNLKPDEQDDDSEAENVESARVRHKDNTLLKFEQRNELDEGHMKEAETETEYKYKCKQCLVSFRNIHYLNRHVKAYHGSIE